MFPDFKGPSFLTSRGSNHLLYFKGSIPVAASGRQEDGTVNEVTGPRHIRQNLTSHWLSRHSSSYGDCLSLPLPPLYRPLLQLPHQCRIYSFCCSKLQLGESELLTGPELRAPIEPAVSGDVILSHCPMPQFLTNGQSTLNWKVSEKRDGNTVVHQVVHSV